MREDVATRLLELNREFYQSFAGPFSQTRTRLQPGVLRAVEELPLSASVLDLGCGHGLLAAELRARGHRGAYIGVDSSAALIEMARNRTPDSGLAFVEADLTDPDWVERLRASVPHELMDLPLRFDRIFAFATLHHIPDSRRRAGLATRLRELLPAQGRLTLSVWNFLASPRLRKRIVPWRQLGLSEGELEDGDFLLDWRQGGRAFRYVHHFTEPELVDLAHQAGFRMLRGYLADGEEGILGRYQIWEPR